MKWVPRLLRVSTAIYHQLIIDKASCYAWVFLTTSKDPSINIITKFFTQHGHVKGGWVCTNQGGELARSAAFQDLMLHQFHYSVEPTGADSPSQNGTIEIYNWKFATRTRTLLYGSRLPAKFWSAALLHLVYLHNRLVHLTLRKHHLRATMEYGLTWPHCNSLVHGFA